MGTQRRKMRGSRYSSPARTVNMREMVEMAWKEYPKAFQEGRLAAEEGCGSSSNPYDHGTDAWKDWSAGLGYGLGYADGQREAVTADPKTAELRLRCLEMAIEVVQYQDNRTADVILKAARAFEAYLTGSGDGA